MHVWPSFCTELYSIDGVIPFRMFLQTSSFLGCTPWPVVARFKHLKTMFGHEYEYAKFCTNVWCLFAWLILSISHHIMMYGISSGGHPMRLEVRSRRGVWQSQSSCIYAAPAVQTATICLEVLISTGWRPSLVGWRPSLVGWRPSQVGWKPSLLLLLDVNCRSPINPASLHVVRPGQLLFMRTTVS